jgi:hypothetical protein
MRISHTGKLVGQLGLATYSGSFALHRSSTLLWEAHTVHEGPLRAVSWDRRKDQYTVLDEQGNKLGWTEFRKPLGHVIVLSSGATLPNFHIQRGWFQRYKRIWLGATALRPAFSLEGSVRVFGNELLSVEHRDFKSDVTYICVPEMEIAALIVSFILFNTANCNGQR